jgi:hypothetical protein
MRDSVTRNVRGTTGPDRRYLPNYYMLRRIGWADFAALRWYVTGILHNAPDQNDINAAEAYQIAQECPLKTYFPPEYRQILLQRSMDGSGGLREEDYMVAPRLTDDAATKIVTLARIALGPAVSIFRARLAILPSGKVLDWHIDTNTSVACRIQIPIFGECLWETKRRGTIEEQVLRPGEVWFTNTGYNHQVKGIGTGDRVCLILGCHFNDIEHYFPDTEMAGRNTGS